MPVSNDERHEICTLFVERFGVDRSLIEALSLDRKNEEVWGATGAELPGIQSARPRGLRIGRLFPTGFKPTSVFLSALGSRITRSRIDIETDALRNLLLGQRIPFDSTDDGYVALVHRGDVLGCGRVHRKRLQALLPTGRRRELLEILARLPHSTR